MKFRLLVHAEKQLLADAERDKCYVEPKTSKVAIPPVKPEDWPRVFEQHLNAVDLDAVMALYEPEARFVSPAKRWSNPSLPSSDARPGRLRREGSGSKFLAV